MKFFEKYLLLLFLIANMISEYRVLIPVSKILFYAVLILSIPCLFFSNFRGLKNKFPELSALIVIYIFAQLVFQVDLWTQSNILYTVSKCVVFAIMMICINSNFRFYFRETLNFFPMIIVGLIAVGWVYNRVDSMGMICFGFINRNVACTLATAGFAGFMFRNDKQTKVDFLCLVFLFATILYGGSRNALAMCVLILIVRYGISFKLIFVGGVLVVFMIFILPTMGVELTAFERLLGTLNGTVEIDREDERNAALQMIAARPWTGWGYSYANLESIGLDMNAHNGYLTTIENLGWPCGLLVLGNIVIGSLRRLKLYFIKDRVINYHLAIIVSTLFGANQEDYLIGVNQCTTNLFFMSFAVLGFYMSYRKSLIQHNNKYENSIL
ncbi:O-antigen ligase family protein [Bacteroides acidifaciens]|uniref:O-antigen ligase family protein n=1 Tax=Bacteroides acidifaciens TaxID=85831 RepID=UPI0030142A2F